MKTKLLILLFLLTSSVGFSQSSNLNSNHLNMGVGLSGWGVPFYIGLDIPVHPDITIGGEFSYHGYRENWKSNTYDHTVLGFSGNANYYFDRLLQLGYNFDFYAGLSIGYFTWNSPNNYDGTYRSGLGLGGQVGGRYFFTNRMGINVEFGGRNTFNGTKFGITIKL